MTRKVKGHESGRQFDSTAGSVYRLSWSGEKENTQKNGGETSLSCLILDKARRGAFYNKREYEISILWTEG